VLLHQRLQQFAAVGAEDALLHEDLSQRLGLVEHPSIHRLDESITADEVHLQSQNSEQQVAVG
jgi:hypothetical protein